MTNVVPLRSAAPAQAIASSAKPSARSAQPIDAAKLEALQQAIHAGRYPVDASKLAAKMVELGITGPSGERK